MLNYDAFSKSFHKHLYEHVGSMYYCHFPKLAVGQDFHENLWIQPVWGVVPIYRYCPQIVKVTLRLSSIITSDPLLTDLRQMVDFVLNIYKLDHTPYATNSNVISIYTWDGDTISNPTPVGYAESLVRDITELPVSPSDTVAVVNVPVSILICCWS